jgi:hypothetical protein
VVSGQWSVGSNNLPKMKSVEEILKIALRWHGYRVLRYRYEFEICMTPGAILS